MRVVISEAAEAELEKIGDHIAKDNPRRAVTFVDELQEAALSLAEYPEAYQLISRYERYGYRRRPYGLYVIIYSIEADHLAVAHFLHGAQDYQSILFPDR